MAGCKSPTEDSVRFLEVRISFILNFLIHERNFNDFSLPKEEGTSSPKD